MPYLKVVKLFIFLVLLSLVQPYRILKSFDTFDKTSVRAKLGIESPIISSLSIRDVLPLGLHSV